MSQKNRIYKAIQREYEQIRSRNAAALRQRKEQVYSHVPRISEIEDEMSLLGIRIGGLVIKQPERAVELAAKLRQDIAQLRKEKDRLLCENGYSIETLNLEYDCQKCNDTGYIGTDKCTCMKQKLMDAAYDQSNVRQIIEIENFDTFDIRLYSESTDPSIGLSPRENMKEILRICLKFTKNFGREYNNLLFHGGTGLGKTFICNCIAKELLDNGFTVLYMTAGQLFKMIEEQRFGKMDDEEKEDYTDDILDADLFIIDDLGTEFSTILSSSELFHIINARLLKRRPVVLSTNLSPANFVDQYSDRLVSRMMGEYEILHIIGNDIRVLKKYN